MKLYPMNNLTDGKRIYNYRFSRMRRISENGFEILANRFRVFRIPLLLEPWKVKMITLAARSLHNWLRSQSNRGKVDMYGDLEQMDNPTDTWFPLVNDVHGNHSSNQARAIRQEYTEYFMNEGSVPWQRKNARIDV